MRWAEDEYQKLRANIAARDSRKLNERKSDPRDALKAQASAQAPTQDSSGYSYRIVVIAKKKREADPDNIWPKWIIDELVRSSLLPGDSSKHIEAIEKRVEKTKPGEKESLIVEIWRREK